MSIDEVLDLFKGMTSLFKEIVKSNKLVLSTPPGVYYPNNIIKGSKWIDNSDLKVTPHKVTGKPK